MSPNTKNRRYKPLLSPLRYPGSKRRLTGYIYESLELNGLAPTLYVEPFAGGASVALQLMQDDVVDKVILMDRDPLIASFWKVVFFDAEWLVDQVEKIEITLERWYEFKHGAPETVREQALTCFFLNRTSFSGILAGSTGPIGGKGQTSKYPIDCRFPRETLIRRINQAAAQKDRIFDIWDCSWQDGLNKIRELQLQCILPIDNLFFYFDPPFFDKADQLYRYYFKNEDHLQLRDYLLALEDSWVLSYDSAEKVEALYGPAVSNGTNGTRQHEVELLYSTSVTPGSQPAKEVILSNLKHLPSETRLWKTDQERKANSNGHKLRQKEFPSKANLTA